MRAPVYLNSYVSIALLPRHDASIAEGRVCRVSGWGYTSPEGGQIPSTLRTVKLPIVSTEKCNSSESFDGRITENMLCAGYSTGGKDACQVRAPQCFYSLFWILGIWTVVEKSTFSSDRKNNGTQQRRLQAVTARTVLVYQSRSMLVLVISLEEKCRISPDLSFEFHW